MKTRRFKKKPIASILSLMFLVPVAWGDQEPTGGETTATKVEVSQSKVSKSKRKTKPAEEVEVISVTGFRQSLARSAELKRNADTITDAISAEDIGKLPDANVSEAMQRITGIQIERDEAGNGSGFQVRGMSDNRVEINGATSLSNTADGQDRSSSFEGIPSGLFKSIEVIKTPKASMIEGSMGATVQLKTYRPLDFKKGKVSVSAGAIQDDVAEDTGYNAGLLVTDRYDWGHLGKFGFTFNATHSQTYTGTNVFQTEWRPAIVGAEKNQGYASNNLSRAIVGESLGNDLGRNDPNSYNYFALQEGYTGDPDALPFPEDYTVYRPHDMDFNVRTIDMAISGLSTSFQWSPTENLSFTLDVNLTESERNYEQTRLRYTGAPRLGRLNLDPATYNVDHYQRSIPDDTFFVYENPLNSADNATDLNEQHYPYDLYSASSLERGILTQAEFSAVNSTFARFNDANVMYANSQGTVQEEKRNTFGFHIDWVASDSLTVNFDVAHSTFELLNNTLWFNSSVGIPYADAADMSGRVLRPTTYFDFKSGRDLPTVNAYFKPEELSEALGIPMGTQAFDQAQEFYTPANSASHIFNEIGGNKDRDEADETAANIDFNLALDKGIFTNLKFGMRYSETNKARTDRTRLGLVDDNKDANNTQRGKFDQHSFIGAKQSELGDGPFQPGSFASISAYDNGRYSNFIDEQFTSGHRLTDGLGFNDYAGLVSTTWPKPNSVDIDTFLALGNELFVPEDRVCVDPDDTSSEVTCLRDHNGFALQDGSNVYRLNSPDSGYEYGPTTPNPLYYKPWSTGTWEYKEDTSAAYIMTDYEGELFGFAYTGNIGVRVVQTNFVGRRPVWIDGNDVPESEKLQDAYTRRNYSNVLPSGNLAIELMDDMYFRVGLAKTMSRPSPQQQLPGASAINANAIDNPDVTPLLRLGNPNLRPAIADQLDLSWEYYLNEHTSFSAGYFFKSITDEIELIRFSRYGVPNEILPVELSSEISGADEIRNMLIEQSVNSGNSEVQGFELGANVSFDFLPGWLSGFGMQANFTKTDHKRTALSDELSAFTDVDDLTGYTMMQSKLSPHSANFTLFYERGGVDFRAAYNWRDSFRTDVSRASDDTVLFATTDGGVSISPYSAQSGVYREDFGQLDLSMGYKFQRGPRVSLQAKNVLEDPRRNYLSKTNVISSWEQSGMQLRLVASWNINI